MADLGQAAAWHRQIAAFVVAADRAGVATTELPELKARLLRQQTFFAQLATRSAAPLPALAPSPTEIAAAASTLGDLSDNAVDQAVRTATATLDQADAALATHLNVRVPAGPASSPTLRLPPPGAPAVPAAPPVIPIQSGTAGTLAQRTPAVRNMLVYGAFSVAVIVLQALLFLLLSEENALIGAAPVCLIVLPAFAWLGGWVTVGILGPTTSERSGNPGTTKTNRTPRLGLIICLIPDLLLFAYLAFLVVRWLATR